MVLAVLGAFVLAPLSTSAAPNRGTGTATFTGQATDGTLVTGTVTDLVATVNDAGDVVISGVLTTAAGSEDIVATLIGATQQECDILHLDLGPLFLDVLGLQVDLSEIVLDITAVPGPGNLLGNLLCAVVHLLDGNASGNAIANLLNRLFDLLGLLG
ncbi:MAG TPA: hypothetical protein VKB09_00555 [Thermomicrobiales bacterium]|nr:hypothetical protein [Thermomicrobiales bacterium]